MRLGDCIDGESAEALASPRCAMVDGFSVHANVVIPARDRSRLERLCRYAARPPLATERLAELADGRLSYELKSAWRDGTTHVAFERVDFLAKLAALIPPPRVRMARYHGVLAPASAWRRWIVPRAQIDDTAGPDAPVLTPSPPGPEPEGSVEKSWSTRQRNYSWAQLMRRVFAIDVLLCPNCGGRMRIVAAIHPPDTTRKILDCLGLPSRTPPLAPAVPEFSDNLDTF